MIIWSVKGTKINITDRSFKGSHGWFKSWSLELFTFRITLSLVLFRETMQKQKQITPKQQSLFLSGLSAFNVLRQNFFPFADPGFLTLQSCVEFFSRYSSSSYSKKGGWCLRLLPFMTSSNIQRLCTHSSPWFAVAKIIVTEKPSNSGVLIKFVLYRN